MIGGDLEAAREAFEEHHGRWRKFIDRKPELQLSSRTPDYTENRHYRKMISLGVPALPYIMERIAEGDFLLNRAVLEIMEWSLSDIIPDPSKAYSEQEISHYLLEWWRRYIREGQKALAVPVS